MSGVDRIVSITVKETVAGLGPTEVVKDAKNNLLKLKTILTLILSFRYEKMARICFLVFKSLSKIGNEHCPKWSQGHSRPI